MELHFFEKDEPRLMEPVHIHFVAIATRHGKTGTGYAASWDLAAALIDDKMNVHGIGGRQARIFRYFGWRRDTVEIGQAPRRRRAEFMWPDPIGASSIRATARWEDQPSAGAEFDHAGARWATGRTCPSVCQRLQRAIGLDVGEAEGARTLAVSGA